MIIRNFPKQVFPIRALKQVAGVTPTKTANPTPQGTPASEAHDDKVPFIPREFAKETIEFFRPSSPHVKSLLDLVFSPIDPQDTQTDREEFDAKMAEFKTSLEEYSQRFRRHEENATRLVFNAIRNLPEDLYDEAIAAGSLMPPEELQFHVRYKDQLMASLSDFELLKLQTYANLMHIRYAHSDSKKKHPEKFFISGAAALNMRKEQAKSERNIR